MSQTIYDRHESVGLALNTDGRMGYGGSFPPRAMPKTILPLELFDSLVATWFSLWPNVGMSDNEVSVYGLAHGRSASPHMNHVP